MTGRRCRWRRRCWNSHRTGEGKWHIDENLANLRKLNTAEFDKAYVGHEVAYHEAVLDALDKTLIPGASNEELKALLVKVRPAFAHHLEDAKQLQAKLDKSRA